MDNPPWLLFPEIHSNKIYFVECAGGNPEGPSFPGAKTPLACVLLHALTLAEAEIVWDLGAGAS